MMRIIGKNFSSRQGRGYYVSEQCGSHEETHLGLWYTGVYTQDRWSVEKFVLAPPLPPLPPFSVWYDDTPYCDVYCKKQVILITGSPWDTRNEYEDIVQYEVQYDENYDYSGNGAEAFLEMYHAECFRFTK